MGGKNEIKQVGSGPAETPRQPAAAFKGASTNVPGQSARSRKICEIMSLLQNLEKFPSLEDELSRKAKEYIFGVPEPSYRLANFASFMEINVSAVSKILVEICNDETLKPQIQLQALALLSRKESIDLIIDESEMHGADFLDQMKVILEQLRLRTSTGGSWGVPLNASAIQKISSYLFHRRQELLLTPKGLELLPYALTLYRDESHGFSSLPAKRIFLNYEVSGLPAETKREILSRILLLSDLTISKIGGYAMELLHEKTGSPSSIPPSEYAGSLA